MQEYRNEEERLMNKYVRALHTIQSHLYIGGDVEFVAFDEIKTLDELVEKATPKKPIQLENKDRSRCPNCKSQLPFRKNALKKQNPRIYCDRCGQAIYWSDEDEKK